MIWITNDKRTILKSNMKIYTFFVSGLLSLSIFCLMYMSLMESDLNVTLNLFSRQLVHHKKFGEHFQQCNTTVITAYFESNLSKHSHNEYNGWMKNMLCNVSKINVLQDYLLQIYDKYKQFRRITVEYFYQLTNQRSEIAELCLFMPPTHNLVV